MYALTLTDTRQLQRRTEKDLKDLLLLGQSVSGREFYPHNCCCDTVVVIALHCI